MQIVVGQPFSAFWDPIKPPEIGECSLCRQKNATQWKSDHSMRVGHKMVIHLQGDLCKHCLNFHPNSESKLRIDTAYMRLAQTMQRRIIRNTPDILARWQARKLRRCLKGLPQSIAPPNKKI